MWQWLAKLALRKVKPAEANDELKREVARFVVTPVVKLVYIRKNTQQVSEVLMVRLGNGRSGHLGCPTVPIISGLQVEESARAYVQDVLRSGVTGNTFTQAGTFVFMKGGRHQVVIAFIVRLNKEPEGAAWKNADRIMTETAVAEEDRQVISKAMATWRRMS